MALITYIDTDLTARVLSMNPSVRRLNLSHNAIRSAEDEQALQQLATLVYLNVSYNRMTRLGPAWSHLQLIQVLDVSHNEMCVHCHRSTETQTGLHGMRRCAQQ